MSAEPPDTTPSTSPPAASAAAPAPARAAQSGAGAADRERMSDEELRDELTARGRRSACLLGPQDVGKSMFMQFLLHHYHAQAPARWTLAPWFRAAAPELSPHEVRVRGYVSTGLPGQAPVREHLGEQDYQREAGTKDIVFFRASTAEDSRRKLSVDFLDIPGEWVTWKREQDAEAPVNAGESGLLRILRGEQKEPTELVLDHADAAVLFLPFWGLFDPALHRDMDPDILAMTSLQRARNPRDREEKARYMTRNLDGWVERIEQQVQRAMKGKRPPMHLLVVLNQFQEEVVCAYLEKLAATDAWPAGWTVPGLWQVWSDLLSPKPPPSITAEEGLRCLLESTWTTTSWMSWCIQTIGRSELGNRKVHDLLTGLLPMRGGARPETDASLAQKRALGRVHIMPLNLFRDSITQTAGASGPLVMDHRMAHDIIWWLVMQLKGDELWPA